MLFLYTYSSLCRHTMTYIKHTYMHITHMPAYALISEPNMRVHLSHLLLYAVKLNSEDKS